MSRRAVIKQAKISRMRKIEYLASLWKFKTREEIIEDIQSAYQKYFMQEPMKIPEFKGGTMVIKTGFYDGSKNNN